MFAYCKNDPIDLCDNEGTSPYGPLTLVDYWIIHKLVQIHAVIDYHLQMEVYVKGKLGRGFLDLYDKGQHSYYEVKSVGASKSYHLFQQLLKYDSADMMGFPAYKSLTPITPLKKGNKPICGSFNYGNYVVEYGIAGPGLIVYDTTLKTQPQESVPELVAYPEKTQQKIAAAATVFPFFFIPSFGGGGIGNQWRPCYCTN